MKKVLTYFFCTLGVIFFVILLGLTYLWVADPFGVRPLIAAFTMDASVEAPLVVDGVETEAPSAPVVDKNPALTAPQEAALEKVGIDPAKVPSSVTPEMEACFVAELGQARVDEIVAGVSPGAMEILSTKHCYQ